MRRSHVQPAGTMSGTNLTPLIDMAFILVIFLVTTSSFVKEAGVDVDRPKAETALPEERASIVIAVTETGEIWIEEQAVDVRVLRGRVERLYAKNPEGSVVILADKGSLTGRVIEVVDQVRLAGVSSIAIAASPEGAGLR